MTAIEGLRGTGSFTSDARPTNYRELYTMLEPNGNAPLNALLSMGRSESTDDPKFNNFRDELPDRVVSADGAVAVAVNGNATGQSVTMVDADAAAFVVPNTVLVNQTTGEVMLVTAKSGLVLTVTRNVGLTGTPVAANVIADGDLFFIAGSAHEEGAGAGTPVTFDATVHSNYTQIFRTAFAITRTAGATYLRTGDKEDEQRVKALKMHMSDIERAMFFGQKHEDTTGTHPMRFTGGLINEMSVKRTVGSDIGTDSAGTGVLTEEQFDELLISTVFAYGSKQKIAFVGEKVANHLQQFGKDRWKPTALDGTYGVNLTRYQTYAGDLMVHLHPQFRQLAHMKDAMVIIDFPYLVYRYLEGSDTSIRENIQANDADSRKHEYLTECGLEMLQDKVHAYITNWGARA
jgi:hypothetical protein